MSNNYESFKMQVILFDGDAWEFVAASPGYDMKVDTSSNSTVLQTESEANVYR